MPIEPTKRPWFKFDLDFLNQDTIADLRDEFGAAGPLTIFAVLAEAKKEDLSGLRPASKQGTLNTRSTALARLVGAPADTIATIVTRAVELGLLELLDGSDVATGRLVVRSLKRAGWEPKDATAASRQARKRQRDAESHEDEDQGDTGSLPF